MRGRGRESKGKKGEKGRGKRGEEEKVREERKRGKRGECQLCKSNFLGEHTNLWTPAVAGFISLSDPITTDWVPYSHGGLVGEAAAEVEDGQSFLEVRSAAVTPLGGSTAPRDGSHDAVT